MVFTYETTLTFDKSFKKHIKDKSLKQKVLKKIDKICNNPYLGKPLRNVLANKRRERVNSFVIIYEIKGNKVIFHVVQHHNYVYKN